jgi:hypothetical protein
MFRLTSLQVEVVHKILETHHSTAHTRRLILICSYSYTRILFLSLASVDLYHQLVETVEAILLIRVNCKITSLYSLIS